ncbi:MAG: hypothetical protein P0S96_04610 [Simkaniaceae bacterium]|nr:hypothetical protein [Candidatus Sacchlamyda saccharinae]
MRKKILTILLATSIVAGGTLSYLYLDQKSGAGNYKEWSGERFSAKFPADPKESSEELDVDNKKIDYRQLSCEDGGSIYAVSYIDFPGHWKWLGNKTLLTKTFEKFIESEKGVEEVLERQLTTIGGDTALVYRLKQDGKEISGKFIVSGNTLYRVFVTYPMASAEKVKPEEFLDSFQLKG